MSRNLLLLGVGGVDAAAVTPVLQTYTVWGLPIPVSVAEDAAQVVTVAGTSLTEETS